ncbi:hypothetical protein PROFUN_16599 [Planoprotostelium fungivorum]|uniref:Uncharacterized protein n=1 Tax=Planoprotostelium fungivorum TaxID=1890364 RepID=A0A2P6MPG0_9EUKA|nr:hypothetical protein PROFUN_16599 [Planoprotostelium fungivorum]
MDNTTPTVQPTLSQLLPMAASDQFKSFIGHLDNARNDTVQTMKILQTFWALAQNEGARLVSAEQRLNSCAAASEEMLGQTDALVNRLLENGLFEFNLPPALWVDPNSQQYQDTDSLRDSLKTRPSLQVLSCAAASEEMLGQTDALVNRLLENSLFKFNLPPALWVDPNSQQYQDTYNDLATQYQAADGKLEQNGRSVEGRLKTCRKDITTEQQKLQTTLHESYARLQGLLIHQYAYEELLGNYRQYKMVKDANQREFRRLKRTMQDRRVEEDCQLKAIEAQIKSGGAVPFAAKPGPKRQMIAGPATPGLQLYIEGVQRDISHINLDEDTDQ